MTSACWRLSLRADVSHSLTAHLYHVLRQGATVNAVFVTDIFNTNLEQSDFRAPAMIDLVDDQSSNLVLYLGCGAYAVGQRHKPSIISTMKVVVSCGGHAFFSSALASAGRQQPTASPSLTPLASLMRSRDAIDWSSSTWTASGNKCRSLQLLADRALTPPNLLLAVPRSSLWRRMHCVSPTRTRTLSPSSHQRFVSHGWL